MRPKKLFYTKTACSLAIRIVLKELGIEDVLFEHVDLKTKKTRSGENYLDINPKGPVPALVLENGSVITENAVILQFLADTNGSCELLPAVGQLERYEVLSQLNFISTDIHKFCCSPIFNLIVPEETKEKVFRAILKQKLLLLDRQLKDKKFLALGRLTIADAYLFVILSWLPRLGLDLKEFEALPMYFENLQNRKTFIEAVREDNE